MGELWFHGALEFGNDALRQHLAQLDSPLVKRVDLPERALREHNVFVQRDQFAKNFRLQSVGKNSVRRAVTFKNPVWDQPIRCSLGLDLLGCFAEGERFGLSEDVREEHVVMTVHRREGVAKSDKIA